MWKHESIEALPCARSIFLSACIGSWLKKAALSDVTYHFREKFQPKMAPKRGRALQ